MTNEFATSLRKSMTGFDPEFNPEWIDEAIAKAHEVGDDSDAAVAAATDVLRARIAAQGAEADANTARFERQAERLQREAERLEREALGKRLALAIAMQMPEPDLRH